MKWRSRAEEWKCREEVDDLKPVTAWERGSTRSKKYKEKENQKVFLILKLAVRQ